MTTEREVRAALQDGLDAVKLLLDIAKIPGDYPCGDLCGSRECDEIGCLTMKLSAITRAIQ